MYDLSKGTYVEKNDTYIYIHYDKYGMNTNLKMYCS